MSKENKSEVFLEKIFERATDPLSQLERINSVVPIFFTDDKNVEVINKNLDSYGYQVNPEYVGDIKKHIVKYGHSSCGSSSGYGHPSCGGYGHPSCGGYSRPSHPSCCSSVNEKGSALLLIPKNNVGKYNEIRN